MVHARDRSNLDASVVIPQDEPTVLRQRLTELQRERDTYQQEVATLRAEREYFRIVADFPCDWECWVAPDGRYRYISPSCEAITGYRPEAFLADPTLMERIIHPDDAERVLGHLHDPHHHGQLCELRFRIITRSGEERWIGHECSPVYSPAGEWLGKRISNRDITAEKQAEAALQESHRFIQQIADTAPYLIYVFDLTRGYNTFVNAYGLAFFGCTLEEMQRHGQELLVARLHPDDAHHLAAFQTQWDEATDDQVFIQEYRLRHADGNWRWLRSYEVVFHRGADGKPAQIMGTAIDMTEHHEAEAALRESRALLQGIIDYAPLTMYIKDTQGRYLQVSQYATTEMGYAWHEFIGKTDDDLFPPDVHDSWHTTDQQVVATGESLEFEVAIPLGDGLHRFIATKFPIFNDQGEIGAIGGIATDITERRRMEAALRASEAKFRSIVEQSSDGISLTDERGTLVEWSAGMEHLTGLPRTAVIGQPAWEMLYRMVPARNRTPALRDRYRESVQSALATGVAPWLNQLMEQEVQNPDGTLWYAQQHSFAIKVSEGFLICSIIRDITEQKRAEQALSESRALLQGVLDHAPVLVFAKDLHGHITLANRQLETLFHVGKGEMIGKTDDDFHPPEIAAHNWDVDLEVQRVQHPVEREEHGIADDGTLHTYLSIQFPLFDDTGQLVGTCGISADITERKRTEESLRASEARYRTLVDNFPDGVVFLFDQDLRYLVAGGTQLSVLGMTPEMLEGKTLWEAVPPDVAAIGYPLYRATINGTAPAEVEQHYGDQIYRTQPVSLRNEQGEVVAGMIISQNITARKQAEKQSQDANERLRQSNERLRQRNQEVVLLNQLGDMLQQCHGVAEAYEVVAINAAQLFEGQAGALYVRHDHTTRFDAVARWGDPPPEDLTLEQSACQSLQRQQVFSFFKESCDLCHHLRGRDIEAVLCVPLVVQGDALGILHLRSNTPMERESHQRWMQLAQAVVRQVSLALNNLTLREQLQQQALHDALTGLYNRRYLDETLPREVQRATRQQQSFGVIMLDIDHFKRFNDTYGHDAGDTLLRAVGHFLKSNTRGGDIACRYGGEEFTLVLPGASLEDTCKRAEQVRVGVKALAVQHHGQTLDPVTASLGVAVFPYHGDTADGVVKVADQSLYQAKRTGRDRVVVGGGATPDDVSANANASTNTNEVPPQSGG